MSETKKIQLTFLSSGILGVGMGIYLNYENILNKEFPDFIMLLAIGLNQLMLTYLSPHIFPKNKRSKEIIRKAMTINYFILFATLIILILLTSSLGSLILSSTQALSIIFCIMVITIPGTMIIYSKLITNQ
ncbi:hypothetical protein ACIQVU_19865 [Lysinibacillus sp. NPDC098008]|uniref:hypothetical protein n=1 Tax=Lysinibacillus sp. NPDC098008 TaxID=3364146 RepID=UPI00382CF46C